MEQQEYTFDNYEVNMYNRNAYETAKEFIKKKMEKGMMLGIYGLEGVGKTKQLQVIAYYYKEINPETVFFISKVVGIPKEGQNRNLDIIREVESV